MEASLVTRPRFSVLGVQTRINPWEADYPGIWANQYMPHDAVVRKLAEGEGHYAVYFAAGEPGKVDMLAGMMVGDVEAVPPGLALRGVPAAQYAVFECTMNEIGSTWKAIYDSWLPGSVDYEGDDSKACFEYFPPGSERGMAPVSIHVALKSR